jgi:hypothetical protein
MRPSIFTTQEREVTLTMLLKIIRREGAVEGVLLVGSGAKRVMDRWADIDLSVVVAPEKATRTTWNRLNVRVKKAFSVLTFGAFEYGLNDFISVILLKNYLEIDMGIVALKHLVARRESWKVLWAKSDRVAERMAESWKQRAIPDARESTKISLSGIGHHFRCAAVALVRDQPFRAAKEIEDIRNEIVNLWAAYEKKTAKHFRDVDSFREDIRKRLSSTFHKDVEKKALWKVLQNEVDLYFDVTNEMGYGLVHSRTVEKAMRNFLDQMESLESRKMINAK